MSWKDFIVPIILFKLCLKCSGHIIYLHIYVYYFLQIE